MNNSQLKSTLKGLIKDMGDAEKDKDADAETQARPTMAEPETIELLRGILEEVRKLNAHKEQTDAQIKELKESNDLLKKSLAQQQRFLESMDADKRATNIIALNVPENAIPAEDSQTISQDEEKWALIKTVIGCPNVEHDEVVRLGKIRVGGTCRPLKIVLKRRQDRAIILEKSSTLGSQNTPMNDIRLKKDTHPAIRREFARLRDVEKREKEKPDNSGRTVTYDHQQRAVLVDGIVVDSFMPTFF